METGAGAGSAFADADYEAVGARVTASTTSGRSAEMVLKVKEPLPEEYGRLREGQILFTYLHLAADEELIRALVASGATCIAYETVETDDGKLPLLAPMSEVAGRLATQMGAWALKRPRRPCLLLGGVLVCRRRRSSSSAAASSATTRRSSRSACRPTCGCWEVRRAHARLGDDARRTDHAHDVEPARDRAATPMPTSSSAPCSFPERGRRSSSRRRCWAA